MKKLFLLPLLLIFLPLFGKKVTVSNIDYIQNNGQWAAPVLFKADLHGGWVFLEKNAVTYKFLEHAHKHTAKKGEKPEAIKGHVYKINWLNANINPTIIGQDKQSYYNNYFIGNDESKWKSNVANYKSVYYKDVYANIDFKIYSDGSAMKSDYIVHKNGNPKDLKFQYQGTDGISIDKNGNLNIKTSINTINELHPYAYQLINGKEKTVACEYSLNGNTLSFKLPEGYDKNYDLIIDPTLVFSTYSGSYSDNWGSSATNDNEGNMFLGGVAFGSEYPTTVGAFQTDFAGGSWYEPTDIVITKFNSTGTSRLYSTYLGGTDNEVLASLLCTPKNELIAVMATSSTDFPTTADAYDKTFNGGNLAIAYAIFLPNGTDLAITKLNANGNALIGSTYFGGSGNDGVNLSSFTAYNYGDESRSEVAIDKTGNIYITSTTNSTDLPGTSGKAQSNYGGGESDGLVAKFNSNLSSLYWATYFGGSETDASYSMGLDKNDNIFICGGTSSRNLPGRNNGLNTSYKGGITDGFIAKINNKGTSVLASSYLGTGNYDQAFILDLDSEDNIGVFGQTLGNYPVSRGVYSNRRASQFIHKLNNNLNTSIFSTVFGSIDANEVNIVPTALMMDICGNIYAVGWGGMVNYEGDTYGMPITSDAFQKTTDGSDFYLINLNATATAFKYATYFGENGGVGDHVDGGTSRFDKNGIVYQAACASCNATNAFPITEGVVGPTNNSYNCNMAGFKFKFDLTALQIVRATATPSSGCAPLKVDFTFTATQPGTSYFWDFGDGDTSTEQYPSHTYNQAGEYTVRFILHDADNCNPEDSTTFTISVGTTIKTTLDSTVCNGATVTIANQIFNTTGSYEIILRSALGCDSIITLNLIVRDSIKSYISKSFCKGGSVTIGNYTFSEPGDYMVTLNSAVGCDSFVFLKISNSDSIVENISQTICNGESYFIGDYIFTASGDYTIELRTTSGCDSTIHLSLTVIDSLVENISRTICTGDSVTIGAETYYGSGEYHIHLPSSLGCDSIVNLSLTVLENQYSRIEEKICEGQSISIGNQQFNTSGTYTIHIPSASGCDSIIHLELTVNLLPAIDAIADKTAAKASESIQLNVISEFALTYTWQPTESVSNAFIKNPTATINAPTWFVVSVQDSITSCANKDSVFVDFILPTCSKENIYIPNAFSPNGDGINDVFLVRSEALKSIHLEIYDRWGNRVFKTEDKNEGWDGTFKGQPANVDSYGYYFVGECEQEPDNKIVIKGNVTLLR